MSPATFEKPCASFPSQIRHDQTYHVRESVDRFPGAIRFFYVTSAVSGRDETEAWDDWFTNRADAEDVAKNLAEGVL